MAIGKFRGIARSGSLAPERAAAVVSDRLRVAFDILGGLMGVTARRGK